MTKKLVPFNGNFSFFFFLLCPNTRMPGDMSSMYKWVSHYSCLFTRIKLRSCAQSPNSTFLRDDDFVECMQHSLLGGRRGNMKRQQQKHPWRIHGKAVVYIMSQFHIKILSRVITQINSAIIFSRAAQATVVSRWVHSVNRWMSYIWRIK